MPTQVNRKSFPPSALPSKPVSKKQSLKSYDRLSYVLVIDDSDDILKFMKIHLNRSFSHVLVAKSLSTSGMALLKEHPVDVIIMDPTKNQKHLPELFKKISKQWRHIPIILMKEGNVVENFWNQSIVIVSLIKKPIDIDILHGAIDKALSVRPFLLKLNEVVDDKEDFAEFLLKKEINSHDENIREKIMQLRSQFF